MSQCLSVLSLTLVYCGQTVGRIKMKLDTQVGLGPGHTMTQVCFPHRGTATPPPFLAHICCGEMALLIKMPLGMEVGLAQATLC